MADTQTDILSALRMQEAALLGVLETVRQAIQTILSTQTTEALDGMKTESTDVTACVLRINSVPKPTNSSHFEG